MTLIVQILKTCLSLKWLSGKPTPPIMAIFQKVHSPSLINGGGVLTRPLTIPVMIPWPIATCQGMHSPQSRIG